LNGATRKTGWALACVLLLGACGPDSADEITAPSSAEAPSTTELTTTTVSPDATVATIEDSVITRAELNAISGADLSEFNPRDAIRYLVFNAVLEASARELGIEATPEDVADARARTITESTAASGLTIEEVLEAGGVTEGAFELIVRQRALADLVEIYLLETVEGPSDEELQLLYDETLLARSTVCSSHILVDTDPEALAVLDRALAGEDFAALAMELSTGPSGPNGGDLGCSSPVQYVPEFAEASMAAEVGIAYGPVET
jgi:hypothetical protein